MNNILALLLLLIVATTTSVAQQKSKSTKTTAGKQKVSHAKATIAVLAGYTTDTNKVLTQKLAEDLYLKLEKEDGITRVPNGDVAKITETLSRKGFMSGLAELKTVAAALPEECNVIIVVLIASKKEGFNPEYIVTKRSENFQGTRFEDGGKPRTVPVLDASDIAGLRPFIDAVAPKP